MLIMIRMDSAVTETITGIKRVTVFFLQNAKLLNYSIQSTIH